MFASAFNVGSVRPQRPYVAIAVLVIVSCISIFSLAATASADTTGGAVAGAQQPTESTAPVGPKGKAKLAPDGRTAIAPADAPPLVRRAIAYANEITRKPYIYGGGHKSFRSRGYDCSGAVSFMLRGAKALASPLHSTLFMTWGEPGRGSWITVFSNPGHAYAVVAGLRWDTSGPGERGPRWRTSKRSSRSGAYAVRHPEGQ